VRTLIHLEDAMPRANLRRALESLEACGEQLSHLGATLHDVGHDYDMDAAQLRRAATCIRASGAQALLLAAGAAEVAGTLDTLAAIHESRQPEPRKAGAR
jgi:hypothetical protein